MREQARFLGIGSIVWHEIDADVPQDITPARGVVRILETLQKFGFFQAAA